MVTGNKGRQNYFLKTWESSEQMGQCFAFPEISFFLNVRKHTLGQRACINDTVTTKISYPTSVP